MATDNEKLWIVTRFKAHGEEGIAVTPVPVKVFRTRSAANKYAKDMRSRSRRYGYFVDGVTWGPEQ